MSNVIESQSSNENGEHLLSTTMLDILDDDSLLEVFAYLNFDELLLASRVCFKFLQLTRQRLRKIRHFQLDYRALITRNNDQLIRLRDIFTNIGTNLIAFKFSGGFIMNETLKCSIIENITLSCSNLQHLTLNYIELSSKNLTALKPLLVQLKGLDLGRCTLRDESFGQFICAASELRSLAIPGNAELDGRFFDMWHSCSLLELLDISYCYSLNVGSIEPFLRRAVKLRGIDVTACQWLQKDKQIFNSCNRNIELCVELPELSYYNNA
ncbi:F-box/LRR-repeat protein 15-like [Malaya genurostris]|uniref:F-box/LRR-repeat protein 15-like n=1 Tax=Malaya genurostris TaxID=325434 RepID=UPI0026F39D66|nr:F-box/LRR-repeat protein 15-like [Malaya genurostris]